MLIDEIEAENLKQLYSLHVAVIQNDLERLQSLLNSPEREKINQLDIHGRSPIMLATILNHIQCADLLLRNGADANTQNKDMWSLSHEAISLGNAGYLKKVLNYRDFQRAIKTNKILLDLRASLKDTKDFYVEMSWEFNSWIKFLRNMCPSDTYKVYKSGSNIRIDATLMDFDEWYRWKRGNQSFIFRFTDDDNAEIVFVDHGQQAAYIQVIDLTVEPKLKDFEPYNEVIEEKFFVPITTTYIDVDNVGFERSKTSGLFSWVGSSEKEEDVEGYTCRVFNASNVEIVTKTRMDHMKEEDRQKHLENENKSMSFLINLFEKKKLDNGRGDAGTSSDTRNINPIEYLHSSSLDLPPRIGNARKEVIRSNSFNAMLWLADSFPLNLREQIFPVIDLMSVRNAKFSRLKSFIELQLPSGFPVRISIPLFHMINAQVTFRNVNEPSDNNDKSAEGELDELGLPVFKLNPSLFQVPSHFNIYSTNESLLFDNTDRGPQNTTPRKTYNAVDTDDDYVYLLERFMVNEDSEESSNYKQQIQIAIEESLSMQNNKKEGESSSDYVEIDQDLAKALELSKQDEARRKELDKLEEMELQKVLELSKLDRSKFSDDSE